VVITSRRHESDIFALPEAAQQEMWAIAREVRAGIAEEYAPDGWEVVIKSGRFAGHTVEHAHIRLIPCYDKDPTDARGVVAGRQPDSAR
jgi:diadenosine tetraphosphate (Ap4A) HIT family hydrolase